MPLDLAAKIEALWQEHNGGRPLHGGALVRFMELAMDRLCQARLGARKSPRKAISSAANGLKGGRPRKPEATEPVADRGLPQGKP